MNCELLSAEEPISRRTGLVPRSTQGSNFARFGSISGIVCFQLLLENYGSLRQQDLRAEFPKEIQLILRCCTRIYENVEDLR